MTLAVCACGEPLFTALDRECGICEYCLWKVQNEICPVCEGPKEWREHICSACKSQEMRDLEELYAKDDIALSWHFNDAGSICEVATCMRCGGIVRDAATCAVCSYGAQDTRRRYGNCKCRRR